METVFFLMEGLFSGGSSFRRAFSREGLFHVGLVSGRVCFTGGLFVGSAFCQEGLFSRGLACFWA